ncbi:MAG: response regulator [Verrucomicrobia bacterium]|nr:response regulator [Verrucomicrobiota bacterium]
MTNKVLLPESKGRILLADDDAAFGRATAMFLRADGYECQCVTSAAEAKVALRQSSFDLLLSDIDMPGNVALELISDLPSLQAGLPAILLTGQPTFDTAARSVGLHVAAYLVKPPDPQELLRCIGESIHRYRSYQAVAAQREKLQNWQHDLERIESLLRRFDGDGRDESMATFLSVTFHNLLEALLDVKHLSETLARGESGKSGFQQFELKKALRDTIAVLQHTRHHFKSTELKNLRRRLEDMLNTTPPGSEATSEQSGHVEGTEPRPGV